MDGDRQIVVGKLPAFNIALKRYNQKRRVIVLPRVMKFFLTLLYFSTSLFWGRQVLMHWELM